MENKKKEIELILENMGLVLSQSLSFYGNSYISKEDYHQAGLIGLLKAIRKYDPTKAKLATFSFHTIKNEILLEHRKNKRNLKLLGEEDVKIKEQNKENFDEFLPEMSNLDKQIINYKLEGYTIADIADKMYMSQNDIKKQLKRIYKEIREANE